MSVSIRSCFVNLICSLFDSSTMTVHPSAISERPIKSYLGSNFSPRNRVEITTLAMIPVDALQDNKVISACFSARMWRIAATISRTIPQAPFDEQNIDYLARVFTTSSPFSLSLCALFCIAKLAWFRVTEIKSPRKAIKQVASIIIIDNLIR